MYLHTPVKTGVCFFAPDKRWKNDEKQKNRRSDGSFALREKVYEEMQEYNASLCVIIFDYIIGRKVLKICQKTEKVL